MQTISFAEQAERIIALNIQYPVNALGGYGSHGEVIYHAHPVGCPSVLADQKGGAAVTFLSNGSTGMVVKLRDGFEVRVLEPSFDPVEKRETGVLAQNVWIATRPGRPRIASLINPAANLDLPPRSIKIVKVGDPFRAIWFCAAFAPSAGVLLASAVKMALVATACGPALLREIYLRNLGRQRFQSDLWTYFNTQGTQQFVYNKQLWYDCGLPYSRTESVVAAPVPYTDILQLKRVATALKNVRAIDATCDYSAFIGDTSAFSLFPQAVLNGQMLTQGAGGKMNRFSTASVAANQFRVSLAGGAKAVIQQSLLYVDHPGIIKAFRRQVEVKIPRYNSMAPAFKKACRQLIRATPRPGRISRRSSLAFMESSPYFYFNAPHLPVISQYANSIWHGVAWLYENCRAHGAMLAQGIELGTRDRSQDMWSKMKADPGRVRADLVHVFSFMYVAQKEPLRRMASLTLSAKLQGMFPRQYPSRWDDRQTEIKNDNRPYADSPLWLINALAMYLRETGDASILTERVQTVKLTDPHDPGHSGIIGHDQEYKIIEVAFKVFESFARQVADSPYKMPQILYGDWCDPVDMFGTARVGDAATRGQGRGTGVRLAAHLFECLVQFIELCEAGKIRPVLVRARLQPKVERLKRLADALRQNTVRWAWEDHAPKGFPAGFLDAIHEFKKDGARPDYRRGETGYTLGSMQGRDYDHINRRVLISQAYGLKMLATARDYLTPVPRGAEMIRQILHAMDTLFYNDKLGLLLYTTPVANNAEAIRMVGRMGVVPAGCAENGEYHHAQAFMHRFRMDIPGQTDIVWKQFKPLMSAMRGAAIAGPFESPANSYASDPGDPHFGKGMNFGLSGSMDWCIEIFQKIAGLSLNLHDPQKPALLVNPNLPREFKDNLLFQRMIHVARGPGQYRSIPFVLEISREGHGRRQGPPQIWINGKRSPQAMVRNLDQSKRIHMRIVYCCGE